MFTNFLAETFDILHIYESQNRSIRDNKFEETYSFIQQLKQAEQFFKAHPGIQGESCILSESNLSFDIFHPLLMNLYNFSNEKSNKEVISIFDNPIKIDLFPYLVKYYYHFFYKKKEQTQSNSRCEILLPNSKRTHHSRHASLASLISVKQDETKTLNKSWQNFTSLNKTKVVNLKKMFEKSSPSKKNFNISTNSVKERIENLFDSPHALNFDKVNPILDAQRSQICNRQKTINCFQDSREDGYKNNTLDSSCINQTLSKNKPELVKKVIQKLESDDFVFKSHSRKKSEANAQLLKGLSTREQINETDEFLFEDSKRGQRFTGGNHILINDFKKDDWERKDGKQKE